MEWDQVCEIYGGREAIIRPARSRGVDAADERCLMRRVCAVRPGRSCAACYENRLSGIAFPKAGLLF